MMLKFGVMFHVKCSIGGNDQHQTENDANSGITLSFRLNPELNAASFENLA